MQGAVGPVVPPASGKQPPGSEALKLRVWGLGLRA